MSTLLHKKISIFLKIKGEIFESVTFTESLKESKAKLENINEKNSILKDLKAEFKENYEELLIHIQENPYLGFGRGS